MLARKWLQAYVALAGKRVNAPNLIRTAKLELETKNPGR
jgi:hypothetical protein